MTIARLIYCGKISCFSVEKVRALFPLDKECWCSLKALRGYKQVKRQLEIEILRQKSPMMIPCEPVPPMRWRTNPSLWPQSKEFLMNIWTLWTNKTWLVPQTSTQNCCAFSRNGPLNFSLRSRMKNSSGWKNNITIILLRRKKIKSVPFESKESTKVSSNFSLVRITVLWFSKLSENCIYLTPSRRQKM